MKTKYYILDAGKPYNGSHINVVLENDKVMHDDISFEEYKKLYERKGDLFILVDPQQYKEIVKEYRQSLIKDFEEIDAEKYGCYMNGVPPKRIFGSGCRTFFAGTAWYLDLYPLCFQYDDKYYAGLRSIGLPDREIYSQISEFTSTLETK